jgi:hypothetical protein
MSAPVSLVLGGLSGGAIALAIWLAGKAVKRSRDRSPDRA